MGKLELGKMVPNACSFVSRTLTERPVGPEVVTCATRRAPRDAPANVKAVKW